MSDEIKKGLLGIVVDETEVSKVMPEINSLTYRGYAAQDLCEYCRFEEVAYLILNKDLPNSIEFVSLFFSLEPALTIFRSLNLETYDLTLFLLNFMALVLVTIFYGIVAIYLFNRSLKFTKKHGTISLF